MTRSTVRDQPILGHLRIFAAMVLVLAVVGVPEVARAQRWEVESVGTQVSPGPATINFQQTFDEPPVVIVLPGSGGINAYAARVSNVTTTSFDYAGYEPSTEDGPHASNNGLFYLAVETGVFTLPNGDIVAAGTFSVSDFQHNGKVGAFLGAESWLPVSFGTTFSANPALLVQLQTIANANPSASRMVPMLTAGARNINTTDFEAAMERSGLADAPLDGANLNAESYGWIAISTTGASTARTFPADGDPAVNYTTTSFSGVAAYTGAGASCGTFSYWSGGGNPYSSGHPGFAAKVTHAAEDGGWARHCSNNTFSGTSSA